METANAFDLLILPILKCTAGIFATFPVLHGIRVGLGYLFGSSARPEPETIEPRRTRYAGHRPAGPRFVRGRAEASRTPI